MKAGWRIESIGEACEVINGGTPDTQVPEYWDGSNLWITPAEMGRRTSPYIADTARRITNLGLNNSSARLLPPNSVILSSRAPIGHLVINTKPMATNQGCKGLVPRNGLNHKFLYYYLLSKTSLLESLGTGATFKELSAGKLKEVKVPVAPAGDQRRIVAILDKAFAAIATAKANTERNLQNARSLFERHLEHALEPCGRDWSEKRVGDICELRSGTTLPQALEKPAGELPYLKVADMNLTENTSGIVTSSRYVNPHDVSPTNVFPVGTTIFPKRGGAIFTNKKRLTLRPICADLNIMGVTPRNGLLPQFLLSFFLKLDLREINSGSSIPQINNYNIAPLPIAFPHSIREQEAIVNELDSLLIQVRRFESACLRKIHALDALKESLLSEAFAGAL